MTGAEDQQLISSPSIDLPLLDVLHRHFGFANFRANQEAVCRAAIDGQDVLLVMPTGAGKSLCYQLPAIARGGTTLVVSPLIALMEDQVAKLSAQGLQVARIHSGRERTESRQACIEYLNGTLQFLFIAPERLRVPGFAEMLARRKPSLIAIDEAHCISAWGHDFRRDYRTLGQHLPALRPAPVIALTATATPLVQDDIVKQLGLRSAARFIHGFRRDNLAIEVVETPKPRRADLTRELLAEPARRPAIVYAPSRKEADALAAELSPLFPTAAYHAGLDAQHRDRVQQAFLAGELETVVATIAFGMGIDKADIRTVIHTSIPATLEAFYQEIGRAGRDGKPSRTVLMYSWADRRLLEFFLERDYPNPEVLHDIRRRLRSGGLHKDALRNALKMDAEVFDRALEKLSLHGGASVDYSDNVVASDGKWSDAYAVQLSRRQAQIDQVMQYAEASQCRMAALVRHFGDIEDGRRSCGQCDFCSPERCIAQQFRAPGLGERQTMETILKSLDSGRSISIGQLYKQLFPHEQMGRNDFDVLLNALASAGLVSIEDAVFEKEGRSINYRKVSLTRDGEDIDERIFDTVLLKEGPGIVARKPSAKPISRSSTKSSKPEPEDAALTGRSAELWDKLRAWRLEEANKLGVRAFHILGNRTLRAVAVEEPRTIDELLSVAGIGPSKAEKFGEAICRVCSQ
ncbi:ATP-dependent DNA helicase RecQ [Acidisarcina polymorpha]|uniref:ATP-dependent DNA helicase RecQ n=1 Tax=Acidisarcina polymorpha TaxID=2211140 RepID=A0A2Z5FVJ8_9BACT|nr:ATP-dependent DNA helicase RecQ [Acidisarcina polymorpha]AXC10524.1 ATP-dependent DNA helicase RecQ [Acidisarcina polymorpha]